MSGASKSVIPRRVLELVWWGIVLLVAFITGRTVYAEQQAALATCAPECDLVAVAVEGIDVVVAAALAVPTFSAFGVPVGVGLSLLISLWLWQVVHHGPRV